MKFDSNNMSLKFKFKCKVCGKEYEVGEDEIYIAPFWYMENCSEECAKVCSKKKLLNPYKCTSRRESWYHGVNNMPGVS